MSLGLRTLQQPLPPQQAPAHKLPRGFVLCPVSSARLTASAVRCRLAAAVTSLSAHTNPSAARVALDHSQAPTCTPQPLAARRSRGASTAASNARSPPHPFSILLRRRASATPPQQYAAGTAVTSLSAHTQPASSTYLPHCTHQPVSSTPCPSLALDHSQAPTCTYQPLAARCS